MTNEKLWMYFKYMVYLVGWSFMLVFFSFMNYRIFLFLLYVDITHAVVTALLTTALYPIWIVGVVGIVRSWKLEAKNGY